jgi:hypothetical protein
MDHDDYDETPPSPPSPIDVARRALILSGVVCRANLEFSKDEEYRRQTAEYLHEWFDELDLWPHLEPDEVEIIKAPFGKLRKHLRVQGTWFVEGLAILTWALKRTEFPPHDRKVDAVAITDALDFLSPEPNELLTAPRLRDVKELEAAREWFYDVHCTLRQFLLHNGDGHLAKWIGQYVAVLGLDPTVVMVDGHLSVDGGPLQAAERERLEDWEAVIRERHRATTWLEGSDEPYTEITVDT